MENLFAENFTSLFTFATNVDLHASRNCWKFVYCLWAIRVHHAAEHLCRVVLNPFQESYILWRAVLSIRAGSWLKQPATGQYLAGYFLLT